MRVGDIQFTSIGGLNTACIGRQELVDLMAQRVRDYHDESSPFFHQSLSIYSTNGHSISIANRDPEMAFILNNADILHADGQSVVSLSRYFADKPIPERSATTDTIHDIAQLCSHTFSHYLLGGKAEIVSKCAATLSARYSNFKVAGHQDGYFSQESVDSVLTNINESKSDILWVGLGKPKEQQFIYQHLSDLKVPVIISCGGCFNFVTGDYKRAPNWMQVIGLEWLHRALSEPRKLLWRYLTTNPHAIYCVLKHRYFGRKISNG